VLEQIQQVYMLKTSIFTMMLSGLTTAQFSMQPGYTVSLDARVYGITPTLFLSENGS
jgi:hypothetical protein